MITSIPLHQLIRPNARVLFCKFLRGRQPLTPPLYRYTIIMYQKKKGENGKMNKQLNFKLRENKPHDNPDYKYELDIDTNNVKLMSQIINSTLLVESNDETGVTLYSNNKQALLGEKQRIEQLFLDTTTNKKTRSTPNTTLEV